GSAAICSSFLGPRRDGKKYSVLTKLQMKSLPYRPCHHECVCFMSSFVSLLNFHFTLIIYSLPYFLPLPFL
ncbi:hypothetical protein L9F63_009262, partial [Diploptera punctata]